MTPELLSTIQFACLIVCGLMAAIVSLFVFCHSFRRTLAEEQTFFGVPTSDLDHSPSIAGAGSADDHFHAVALFPLPASNGECFAPDVFGRPLAASSNWIHNNGQKPLTAIPDSARRASGAGSIGPILVLQGCGDTFARFGYCMMPFRN